MNEQKVWEEWDQIYAKYEEANERYNDVISKYFRLGVADPMGNIERKNEINLIDDKTREEIQKVIRERKEASDDLDKVEQRMFKS